MTDTFANAPKWFIWALHEVGTRELPENRGPAIRRYIQMAHCGAEGDPWCAIFVNAALEQSGVAGSRSPSSQSFRYSPKFVKLAGPALGAIAVFWRTSPSKGIGHVGFYRGEAGSRLYILGGNEGDMVQIEAMPTRSATFGFEGYYWPRDVALPPIKAILMPHDTPSHGDVKVV